MIDCVVVGGGPAGLAASAALTRRGVEHVILERGRVGQTWRT
jgi:putative flavoprotein involved in K+ transport